MTTTAHDKNKQQEFWGVTSAIVTGLGFGTGGIFGTFAARLEIPLSAMLAWRFLVSACVLLLLAYFRKRPWVTGNQFLKCFLIGAIGFSLQSWFFFAAIERIGAGLTSVFLYLYPSFVTLLAWLLLKERPSRVRVMAIGLALIGCILTCYDPQAKMDYTGVLYALCSGVVYACYLLSGQIFLQKIDNMVSSALILLGTAVPFLFVALTHRSILLEVEPAKLWPIAGMILVATVLPISSLFSAISKIGVTRTALLSTIEPAFTVTLSYFLLGETLVLRQIFGALVIVSSVILANIKST